MNRRFRITPKKVLVVAGVLAFLWLCVGLYTFGNPRWYIHTPHDCPNTRWTCEELDFFFLSDKHGHCYGEITLDGEKKIVNVAAGKKASTYVDIVKASTLDGVYLIREYGDTLIDGWSSYKKYAFETRVTEADPRITEALGAEPPFTLHFTREDLDEEICFGGEGCAKCWDERGRN